MYDYIPACVEQFISLHNYVSNFNELITYSNCSGVCDFLFEIRYYYIEILYHINVYFNNAALH